MPSDAKQNLMIAGTQLFAEHGFAGASVRDICTAAGVGRNMIHHYFGNKDGLLAAILDEFSNEAFAPALRIIETPAKTAEEFRLKLDLFITEKFEVLISYAQVFRILHREGSRYLPMKDLRDGLVAYVDAGQKSGFVSTDIDSTLIPGFLLDRLGNQILFALAQGDTAEHNVLINPDYKSEWLTTNKALLMFGFVAKS